MKQAGTLPLPQSFPKSEPGLMTWKEFLAFRNPGDKHHPSDSYDFSLMDLNKTFFQTHDIRSGGHLFTFEFSHEGTGFIVMMDDLLVGVVHAGMLFHSNAVAPTQIPLDRERGIFFQKSKRIKYPVDFVPLVSNVAVRNRRNFPVLIQNLILQGDPIQLRAESTPTPGTGVTLGLLNSKGEVIAQASDEWGATLITVAKEYRGLQLGRVLGKFWYKFNPDKTSGGFTSSGEANALRIWEDRVREFASNGWYTDMVRSRRITPERVKQIISGVSGKRPVVPPKETKTMGDVLVFVDNSTFVVYDSKFFEDQDEKYIHGYGFLRSADPVGTFYYTLDYDSAYRSFVTNVAMQMARDEGDPLYVGPGYGDTMELDGVPGLATEGDYVRLTRDIINLKAMAAKEKRLRKPQDPHGEVMNSLLEMGESKWR